jgi:hypothetical protein
MMRIWNRITGDPWAITETALHTILEVAARENEAHLKRLLPNSVVNCKTAITPLSVMVWPLFL